MTKILIVEDEITISNDLEDIIEDEGFHVVGKAYTGAQAIELVKSRQPELVMLDISLKGDLTGLDVAKHINEHYNIPFVFLTSFSDKDTIAQVIATNPGGYIVKPFKESDIAPAINIALATFKKPKQVTFPSLDLINRKVVNPLTTYEYNVLKEVWNGKKNADIASSLFISVNTVKTHLLKSYNKLDVSSRSEAVSKIVKLA